MVQGLPVKCFMPIRWRPPRGPREKQSSFLWHMDSQPKPPIPRFSQYRVTASASVTESPFCDREHASYKILLEFFLRSSLSSEWSSPGTFPGSHPECGLQLWRVFKNFLLPAFPHWQPNQSLAWAVNLPTGASWQNYWEPKFLRGVTLQTRSG